MNKNRFKRSSIVAGLIVFFGIVIAALLNIFLNPLPDEYFIFQNLEECELLISADQSQDDFERYNSPDSDKKLKDLQYNDFFGMKFHSDELEYEIFAYEFADADSALKYYVNVTGQHSYEKKLPLNSEDENKIWLASKGMFSFKLVVVYQNRAYQIIAPNQYIDEIDKLLSSAFSQKII